MELKDVELKVEDPNQEYWIGQSALSPGNEWDNLYTDGTVQIIGDEGVYSNQSNLVKVDNATYVAIESFHDPKELVPSKMEDHSYRLISSDPAETIEKVVHPSACWINNFHRKHPYTDFFKHACAAAMIREFKPNLMFLHSTNLDSYRHETGVFSRKVTHGLHEADSFLATVLKACDEVGITDKTDFFVVSDKVTVS